MALFLAGNRLTADLLNDNTVEDSSTTGLVAATNFTVVSFSGRRVNGFTTVNVFVQRTTGSIAGSSTGNIADTEMCTLPEEWWPPESVEGMWGNGFNDGQATCNTAGVISVRTSSGTDGIGNLTNVRAYFTWASG